MQEYYFLFALGIIWTLVATIQDLKKREIANWLNFSLIAFALSYRAFYSVMTKNFNFFLLGLISFILFFILAYAFYYAKVFAGGDAKLLMGYGVLLPIENFKTLLPFALTFIFALFLIGAAYSLIYSVGIVIKNKKQFKKEFSQEMKKNKSLLFFSLFFFIAILIASIFYKTVLVLLLISPIPVIYIYTKALDKCMLKLIPANKLTEGDWLENDVFINKKITIKKTVHGLSLEDIKILKKYKRSVLIKEGIPFTPSFLITLLIMVFFFLTAKLSLLDLLSLF